MMRLYRIITSLCITAVTLSLAACGEDRPAPDLSYEAAEIEIEEAADVPLFEIITVTPQIEFVSSLNTDTGRRTTQVKAIIRTADGQTVPFNSFSASLEVRDDRGVIVALAPPEISHNDGSAFVAIARFIRADAGERLYAWGFMDHLEPFGENFARAAEFRGIPLDGAPDDPAPPQLPGNMRRGDDGRVYPIDRDNMVRVLANTGTEGWADLREHLLEPLPSRWERSHGWQTSHINVYADDFTTLVGQFAICNQHFTDVEAERWRDQRNILANASNKEIIAAYARLMTENWEQMRDMEVDKFANGIIRGIRLGFHPIGREDLISITATNGLNGWAYTHEVSPTWPDHVLSEEELEYLNRPRYISVYDDDFTTIIGLVQVGSTGESWTHEEVLEAVRHLFPEDADMNELFDEVWEAFREIHLAEMDARRAEEIRETVGTELFPEDMTMEDLTEEIWNAYDEIRQARLAAQLEEHIAALEAVGND
ncbi:MAG: hypothetical protein FWE20_10645 [Defluviitaleaceae bacterium]|nr:hypothetical protein [Defluviitaleaceae bacterium]